MKLRRKIRRGDVSVTQILFPYAIFPMIYRHSLPHFEDLPAMLLLCLRNQLRMEPPRLFNHLLASHRQHTSYSLPFCSMFFLYVSSRNLGDTNLVPLCLLSLGNNSLLRKITVWVYKRVGERESFLSLSRSHHKNDIF